MSEETKTEGEKIETKDITVLQTQIRTEFLQIVGDHKKYMTDADWKLLDKIIKDGARLIHQRLVCTSETIEQDIRVVNASLASLALAKYFDIKSVFWESVRNAVVNVTQLLVQAAIQGTITSFAVRK